MSAVMWVIKNYKTEVIIRNPASTQAVPQSLWLHLFHLNLLTLPGFLVLAEGLCLFEQINAVCCVCICHSVMFTVVKVLWTVNERQSWTLRCTRIRCSSALNSFEWSAGMKVAALYYVLIPYCVSELRATANGKLCMNAPFSSLWLAKFCSRKEEKCPTSQPASFSLVSGECR